MNKLFIFIFILCIILFYCFSNNFENFINKNNISYKKLPKGLWRSTCIVHDFRDPLLWTLCENDHGKYIETSINIDKCINRKIRNVNGVLECD
jgi:hypothetical protein